MKKRMARAVCALADHPIRYLALLLGGTAIVAVVLPPIDSHQQPSPVVVILSVVLVVGWLVLPVTITLIYFVPAWRARNLYQHKVGYLTWLGAELFFFLSLLVLAIRELISKG